jgi:hypothetical protein
MNESSIHVGTRRGFGKTTEGWLHPLQGNKEECNILSYHIERTFHSIKKTT